MKDPRSVPGGSRSVFLPRAVRPVEGDPVAPHLGAGDTLGNYQLIQLIGRGGMGTVWAAHEKSLDRAVALKLIRPERLDDKAVAMFQREARAGGRLSHAGLVSIHAYGEVDGVHYICQELVGDGHNLGNVLTALREEEVLPEGYHGEVVEFVAAIAEAMQAAHEAGVIHRDLKPQNILIDAEGKPRITDFGLARISGEDSLSGRYGMLGTYYYMSPEQAMAKSIRIDHRTDLFSLGVVLYEMLTLKKPFDGDTEQQILTRIIFDDPPPPRKVRSRVPLDLSVICMKALEKNREHRYASMRALAEDLERFRNDEPVLARPPGALRRAQKWMIRHPTRSVALAVGLTALLIISILLARTLRAEEDARQKATQAKESAELANTRREEAVASALLARQREHEAIEARVQADEQRREAEQAAEREKAQRQIAEEQTLAADAERNNVLRLADARSLRELEARAELLWPVHPDRIPQLEEWLADAQEVIDRLDLHQESLAMLRARSSSPAEVTDLSALAFESDADAWWHETLHQLIADLVAFADPRNPGGTLPDVLDRLHRSRTIEQRSLLDHEDVWSDAILAILESDRYGGLVIEEQMGLVPLGEDPRSGLWEFWLVESGARPERNEKWDRWWITTDSGMVLVLLPGGTFFMGAQRGDASQPNHDPLATPDEDPVTKVTLAPFFLSRYEMTQGQWERIMGSNPSNFVSVPGGPDHPVEQVSWHDCQRALHRLGLRLPTEAQWEYGARAGTSTPWWCGAGRESIGETQAGNLFDKKTRESEELTRSWGEWMPWEDQHTVHAPVGWYAANPFGLHDTIGNVWEWCEDRYLPYSVPPEPDTGLRKSREQGPRVCRGAGFRYPASLARSSTRFRDTPDGLDISLGLRPARTLD